MRTLSRMEISGFSMLKVLAIFSFALLNSCAPATHATSDMNSEDHPSPEDVATARERIEQLGFKEPVLSHAEEQFLAISYGYVDTLSTVPKNLKDQALAYYHANLSRIHNKTYLGVVDFSAQSSQGRLFIINMSSGAVTTLHVAHGEGSDLKNTGFATKFSNVSGTKASSLGYYLTGENYVGSHGASLRLDGLSITNSNARARAIVIHGASYVVDSNVKAGRSWGCLAVSLAERAKVISMLQDGALIYAGKSK